MMVFRFNGIPCTDDMRLIERRFYITADRGRKAVYKVMMDHKIRGRGCDMSATAFGWFGSFGEIYRYISPNGNMRILWKPDNEEDTWHPVDRKGRVGKAIGTAAV